MRSRSDFPAKMLAVLFLLALPASVWSQLQTNTLTDDTLYFSDVQWTNFPTRFYRLRWP